MNTLKDNKEQMWDRLAATATDEKEVRLSCNLDYRSSWIDIRGCQFIGIFAFGQLVLPQLCVLTFECYGPSPFED